MLSEETIRQNLIRRRKEHDMTQKKVAELLCKSRGAYTAYEHGYAVPSLYYIKTAFGNLRRVY